MSIPPENAHRVTERAVSALSVEGKHHPVLTTNLSGLEMPLCLPGTAGFTQHEITNNTACVSQFVLLPGAINSYFTSSHILLLVTSLGSPSLMTSRRESLALISQQSFQTAVSEEGIPA